MTPQGSQPVLGAISTCVGTSVDAGQAAPGVKVRPHVRGNVMIALRVTARYGSPPPLAWGPSPPSDPTSRQPKRPPPTASRNTARPQTPSEQPDPAAPPDTSPASSRLS